MNFRPSPFTEISPAKKLAWATLWLVLAPHVTAEWLREVRFEPLIDNESLPSPWIKQVHQDAEGFLWMPTNRNLIRFDGDRIAEYYPNTSKAGSLSCDKPNAVASDAEGVVWILSPEGISAYDPDGNRFENYPLLNQDGISLTKNANSMELLANGQMAIGSYHGLLLFDPLNREWIRSHTTIGGLKLNIRDLHQDSPDSLLLATSTGLWKFQMVDNRFSRVRLFSQSG